MSQLNAAVAATVLALSLVAAPAPVAAQEYRSYAVAPVEAHPEWDAEYTRLIRADSTGTEFMTDLVDHLPASATVPSPLQVNGYIAGAAGHLTYAADVHAYMRAVAAASPRVAVFSIGTTEEGREMIAVAVADEDTIARLDEYRDITARLADPRALPDDEARRLVGRGKPIYYLTGGLHSPETGSPEMLMELVYRLAVEDTPMVRRIRDNVITLVTPVLEVDGRERMVDIVRWYEAHPDVGMPPLVYWGHYVAHDNNRDAIGLELDLTRNVQQAYFDWHPQVMHDLHESIPFLYVSSGTGPYNAWLDPLMVGEWERMAYNEVQALTGRGLPGVWTHGFYDGWAPNYLFWIAMGHNSLGRFYETFGNHVPDTEHRVVRGMSERQWFRPNPPLPEVEWSLRNNVNYQQSGVLTALAWVADHREHVLEQFWRLGVRSVAKARTEGPAAYVFTADQPRRGQLRDLMRLLREHRIEVQVADAPVEVEEVWPPRGEDEGGSDDAAAPSAEDDAGADRTLTFPAGSFVVRLDQPYSRLADALLDTQYVRGDERLYDDTGWTLGYARNLQFARVVNPAVLDAPMHAWDGGGKTEHRVRGAFVAVENHADTDLVRLRTRLPGTEMLITEAAVEAGGRTLPAGTVLMAVGDGDRAAVAAALADLDLAAADLPRRPEVAAHPWVLPRVAMMHSWRSTQDEGWYRLAFEDLGIPYDYISTQDVRATPDLRERYDVIVVAPVGRASARDLVEGMPAGVPIPWQESDLTPNLGRIDSTPDVRPGLGLEGVVHLRRFAEAGGLLVMCGSAAELAVDYGLTPSVRIDEPAGVKAPGTLVRAAVAAAGSPVTAGYDAAVPVYFDGGPVFTVGMSRRRDREASRPSGRGSAADPDVPQGRPWVPVPPPAKNESGFELPENLPFFTLPYVPSPAERPAVLLRFPEKAGDILLSGMLEGAGALSGKPLAVLSPLGQGHVLLFGNNPMWRGITQGSYALLTNALLSAGHLDVASE